MCRSRPRETSSGTAHHKASLSLYYHLIIGNGHVSSVSYGGGIVLLATIRMAQRAGSRERWGGIGSIVDCAAKLKLVTRGSLFLRRWRGETQPEIAAEIPTTKPWAAVHRRSRSPKSATAKTLSGSRTVASQCNIAGFRRLRVLAVFCLYTLEALDIERRKVIFHGFHETCSK